MNPKQRREVLNIFMDTEATKSKIELENWKRVNEADLCDSDRPWLGGLNLILRDKKFGSAALATQLFQYLQTIPQTL